MGEDSTIVEELRLNRVLVAVDHSDSAALALRAAVTVARRDRAVLTLLTVVPHVTSGTAGWVAGAPGPQVLQEDVDQEAAQLMRDLSARVPDDVALRTMVRHGRAGQEIVAAAADGNYDAILLGARGRGRMEAATLGSVSNYVMHHAAIPVFVAHAPRTD